jgi:adenosine deaminase
MLKAGLNLTLNTDDPSISQITLSREHYLACEMLGIPILAYRRCMLRGAGAAFLPALERAALVQKLVDEFDSLVSPQG